MKQEPVAWMTKESNGQGQIGITFDKDFAIKHDFPIPLYTAPKELSDEEIWEELRTVKHTWITTTETWYEFEKKELTKAVRAILKKASEK